MTNFFNSEHVHVFPCANRGKRQTDEKYKSENIIFDFQSRLNTEYNLINLPGICGGVASYVVEYNKNNYIIFVLGGYYFEVDLTNDNVLKNTTPAWVYIKTEEASLDSYNSTKILKSVDIVSSNENDAPILDVEKDGIYKFCGLGVSDIEPGDEFISLPILDENGDLIDDSTKSIDGKRIRGNYPFVIKDKEKEIVHYDGSNIVNLTIDETLVGGNEGENPTLGVNTEKIQIKLSPTGSISLDEEGNISATDTKNTAGTSAAEEGINWFPVVASGTGSEYLQTYAVPNVCINNGYIYGKSDERTDLNAKDGTLINLCAFNSRILNGNEDPNTTTIAGTRRDGDIYIQW